VTVSGEPVIDLMKPNSLIWGARYDRMMDAFGGKGFFVEDPKDLKGALAEAMNPPWPGISQRRDQPRRRQEAAAVPLAQLRH
jgi:thiamine pyrophosphate-dependent acetolactate synthase large subunit-like protein